MSKAKKSKKIEKIPPRARFSKIEALVFAAAFAVCGGLFLWISLAAGPVVMYLSPASKSLTAGGSFAVQMHLQNAAGAPPVSSVDAYVNFPADKLSAVSIEVNNAEFFFTNAATYDNGSGIVHLNTSSVFDLASGDHLVATVTFKSKAGGTANVVYDGKTKASSPFGANSDANVLTGTSGGSYVLQSAAPLPPPATPPPPPPKTVKPPPLTVQPRTAKAPAPESPPPPVDCQGGTQTPVINSANVSAVTNRSARISWTASAATPATLTYGIHPGSLNNSLSQPCATGSQAADLANLAPGTKYFYRITLAGGQAGTYDGSFTTRGWPVVLSFKNSFGQPLSAEVEVGGAVRQTNDKGEVTAELPPGAATARVTAGRSQYSVQFKVSSPSLQAGAGVPTQRFGFKQPLSAAAKPWLPWLVAALGGLVVLGSAFRRRSGRRRQHPVARPSAGHRDLPPPKPPRPEADRQPMPPPVAAKTPAVKAAPQPPPLPLVPKHLTPPPHATEFPWIDGQPLTIHHTPGSSIAAGDDYVEPEDMFDAGQNRLESEGLAARPPAKKSRT